MTPTEPFEEGEQTLIRPDHYHQEDRQEPDDDLKREKVEKIREILVPSEANAGEKLRFKGTSKSETKSNSQ